MQKQDNEIKVRGTGKVDITCVYALPLYVKRVSGHIPRI